MRTRLVIASLAASFAVTGITPRCIRAQAVEPPKVGEVVRISLQSPYFAPVSSDRTRLRLLHLQAQGTVVRVDGTDLVLLSESDSLPIPYSALATLEVKRGKRPALARGALIGAATGSLLGLLFVSVWNSGASGTGWGLGPGESLPVLVAGGGAGTLAGAAVGSQFAVDRWIRVPIDRR